MLSFWLSSIAEGLVAIQVRFFERVKLERRIKQLEKKLQQDREQGHAVAQSDAEALACAQDDLQVRHHTQPHQVPAVHFSLYATAFIKDWSVP